MTHFAPAKSEHRFILIAFTLLAMLVAPLTVVWAQERSLPAHVLEKFGAPPALPNGALAPDVKQAVETVFIESMENSTWDSKQTKALEVIAQSKDPRLVWLIADLMRFVTGPQLNEVLSDASFALLERKRPAQNDWGVITDHLIAWDIPAPPDYLRFKRTIFTSIVPGWDRIFVEGKIDWRHVSWGGVLIDDRPYDKTDQTCNCIPAADNPKVIAAKEAKWPKDNDIVFGVEVNGQYRAYPRQIMEVREMVNDTLGGRDLGIPYCTLCGAAQAYFTDQMPDGVERPVLRTSGLLIRSNKVMYDINSHSVFDTFKGTAVTGPLADKQIALKQASVVTTTWGKWKAAHPSTTVLVEELALGRNFDFRNGRDAQGPIFPVGDVDPRLSVHEDVIGALNAKGEPVAFQRSKAVAALTKGDVVRFGDVILKMDAGGVKAVSPDGKDLGSHQAFWFAWSQFYPATQLWAQP